MSRIARVGATTLPALAAAMIALLACSKPEAPPPLTETPAPPPPSAASPPGASTVPSPAASSGRGAPGLSTEEDFEDESASQITPETLDAQLDALEREIQAE